MRTDRSPRSRVLLVATLALAVAGCNKSTPPAPTPPAAPMPPAAPNPPPTPATPAAPAATGGAADKLDPAKATETAPDVYKVKFSTTKGDFTVEVHRDWAPQGADRFYNLVKLGYYDDLRFFRVVPGFMVQFGIHGDPNVNAKWRDAHIQDDPVKESNKRGTITFATAGPGTRTTQVFINFVDNGRLDGMGFSPFGKVVDGMKVVDSLYGGYGEGAPRGMGPAQGRIQDEGNAYLDKDFPQLDKIKEAHVVK